MLLTEKLALTELYGDGVVQGDSGFEQLLILLMFRSAGRKRGATGLFSSLLGEKKTLQLLSCQQTALPIVHLISVSSV